MKDHIPDSDHWEQDCWCHPRVMQVCPECDGSPNGCWKCDAGLVPQYDDNLPVITIHEGDLA